MELVCFQEFVGLDWIALLLAAAVVLALLAGAYFLAKRPRMWDRKITLRIGDLSVDAPVPVLSILLGAALLVAAYLYLNSRFPANGEGFDEKPKTVGFMVESLRRRAGADIQLRNGADSLVVSQPIGGACTTALVENLCWAYRDSLTCNRDGTRFVIDRK